MPATEKENPHSIKCLKALEGYHGGRNALSKKLGLSHASVSQWIVRGSITPKYILALVDLGDGKFSAEEFLGKFDGGLYEDS